jgi:murein DD-endopeptidase MepM/ murein hydrolase activator NlpD
MQRALAVVVLMLFSVSDLVAGTIRVREFVIQSLAHPDEVVHSSASAAEQWLPSPDAVLPAGEPSQLAVYPVAGRIGHDLVVPYYVDLEPGGTRLDFDCGRLTFNGHGGHDPYIRSFAEQEIGVPVFAVRDGIVRDVHDGEPDQNTVSDPDFKSNYVSIRHNADEVSNYVHLKRGSITVARGEFVTAGTQIGMVGSSGPSTAPHIHFELLYRGEPVEPMAGPCRPGRSYFREQHEPAKDATLLGATFSSRSFANFRPAPFDEAPRTGTFVHGSQTIYFKADLANIGATTSYRLLLQPPGGSGTSVASSGTLVRYDTSLASLWWGLDVDLNRTGTWNVILSINDRQEFVLPFTVVSSPGAIVNRPPHPVRAELGPVVSTQVAVCRAIGELVADDDYDVVRYRYQWQVDGAIVRDVTTAASSDALPRQFSLPRANSSCSVTVSDGLASSQPSIAFITVSDVRRRGVRK